MTLSSSETEWVVLSEALKEVMLMVKLLESMKTSAKFLAIVRVDNVGTIFMTGNISATSDAKHMDIKYMRLKQNVEDEIVKSS